jgi:hypothetical protein
MLTDDGIAEKLNIDRATLYRWSDGIMLALAIELGMADIYNKNTASRR